MRVATKLVTVVIGVMCLVMAAEGYLSIGSEIDLFEADMKRDARLLGRASRVILLDALQSGDREAGLAIINEIARTDDSIDIGVVRLDAPPGDRNQPRAPRNELDPVVAGKEWSIEVADGQMDGHLCTYIPLLSERVRGEALEITQPLSRRNAYVRTTVARRWTLMVALILTVSLVLIQLGMRLIGRPLHGLTEKARRIGAGDFAEPLRVRGRDELAELAGAMNQMCEQLVRDQEQIRSQTAARITAIEQLRHAERLSTVGRLASGIAHELGTPLNVVSGRADLIAGGRLSEAEIVDSARIVRAQSERMANIIRQLLGYARRSRPEKATTDLRDLTRRTISLLASLAQERKVSLSLSHGGAAAPARVDAGQIQQVLTNLIVNAVEATEEGGKVEVSVEKRSARRHGTPDAAEEACVCVTVRDDGAGISSEHVQHLFEPFFTTKEVGKGTGLGLSIAENMVREHGGWIDVQSEQGKGSCFSVYLPAPQESD